MNLAAAEAMARRGRLYPAVILHGGSAQARRAAAGRLGGVLLCAREREDERPCGECRHCRRLGWPADVASFHPDFLVLERDLSTATSVAATRALLRGAQLTPFEARGQVFVVASAESLTGEAANALLKTLEEPPTRAPRHFLLLSPTLFDLLPTVRSRSLPVYLGDGERPEAEQVERLASRFAASARAYLETGSGIHLRAAAAALAEAGGWEDPRALRPWETAAAAVLRSLELSEFAPEVRRRLLALAEDLAGSSWMRLRSVRASRILEGLVSEKLAAVGP